jgi:hypothetical protein
MNARRLISHPSDKGRTLAHRQPRIVRRITCIGTMSELGQKPKSSQRANVVRFTPNSDQIADILDRQLRANSGISQLTRHYMKPGFLGR